MPNIGKQNPQVIPPFKIWQIIAEDLTEEEQKVLVGHRKELNTALLDACFVLNALFKFRLIATSQEYYEEVAIFRSALKRNVCRHGKYPGYDEMVERVQRLTHALLESKHTTEEELLIRLEESEIESELRETSKTARKKQDQDSFDPTGPLPDWCFVKRTPSQLAEALYQEHLAVHHLPPRNLRRQLFERRQALGQFTIESAGARLPSDIRIDEEGYVEGPLARWQPSIESVQSLHSTIKPIQSGLKLPANRKLLIINSTDPLERPYGSLLIEALNKYKDNGTAHYNPDQVFFLQLRGDKAEALRQTAEAMKKHGITDIVEIKADVWHRPQYQNARHWSTTHGRKTPLGLGWGETLEWINNVNYRCLNAFIPAHDLEMASRNPPVISPTFQHAINEDLRALNSIANGINTSAKGPVQAKIPIKRKDEKEGWRDGASPAAESGQKLPDR